MIEDPVKILLVEDNPADVILIKRQLKKVIKDPDLYHTSDFKEFTSFLKSYKPDLIICDYMLTDFTGLDVLQYVIDREPDLPFFFVTSTMDDEKLASDTILNAVTDFVLKNKINTLHLKLLPHLEHILKTKKETPKNPRESLKRMQDSLKVIEKENSAHVKSFEQIKKDLENYNDQKPNKSQNNEPK